MLTYLFTNQQAFPESLLCAKLSPKEVLMVEPHLHHEVPQGSKPGSRKGIPRPHRGSRAFSKLRKSGCERKSDQRFNIGTSEIISRFFPFHRGNAGFPTHACAALEVTLALAICLTVIGGVKHQTLARRHWTVPRLLLNWLRDGNGVQAFDSTSIPATFLLPLTLPVTLALSLLISKALGKPSRRAGSSF